MTLHGLTHDLGLTLRWAEGEVVLSFQTGVAGRESLTLRAIGGYRLCQIWLRLGSVIPNLMRQRSGVQNLPDRLPPWEMLVHQRVEAVVVVADEQVG